MDKRLCTLFSLLVLFWALPAGLSAQDCISGTVYEDLNNNGVRDAGEMGLLGITVSSISQAGLVTQVTTDDVGYYEFCEVESGQYFVYPLLDNPDQRANPRDYTIDYLAGQAQENIDFGLLDESQLVSLSGRAYISYIENGMQDLIEPALTGYTVTLSGGGGQMGSTVTDQFGAFQFTDLPAGQNYEVSITGNPANTEWIGGGIFTIDDLTASFDRVRFELRSQLDFSGLYDRICYDLDGNGQVDPATEPGLGGIPVELIDAMGEVIRTFLSDGNGRYGFAGVPAGSYTLRPIYNEEDFRPTTPVRYDVDLGSIDPVPSGPFYFEPQRRRLRCGMVAHTYGFGNVNTTNTLGVWDIRDRSTAPGGSFWPSAPNPYTWTAAQIGLVRGIAIDQNFNIYVSAIGGTPHPDGAGAILRIDATTLSVSTVVGTVVDGSIDPTGTNSLPNVNAGLGNLCFNNNLNTLLYTTNLEDGSINVIDLSGGLPGTVVQRYIPFGPDDGTDGSAYNSGREIPVAVAYHRTQNRLYFGVRGVGGGQSTVYSIALDAAGQIDVGAGPVSELSITPNAGSGVRPIFDLAFSHDYNEMAIAERGTHNARALTSAWTGASWDPSLTQINFGTNTTDVAGGVDYAYESFDPTVMPEPTTCENYLAATSDALQFGAVYTYGFGIAPPGGGPYSAYVFIDNDNVTTGYSNSTGNQKGRQYDVEVFDCQCSEPNCADENGLDMLPNSPVDPTGVGDCCNILDFNNTGNLPVFAIDFTLLDGVQFQPGYQWDPGVDRVNHSSNSVTFVTPGLSGPLPNNINGLFNFCLENITAVPQFLVIDYRNADYEIFCTDTLEFRCPLQAECLEYVQDSLVCDTLGYKFTIDFEVPPGNEFDIGYIKMNLTQALPAGTSWMPIGAFADPPNSGHTFPTPLVPGDQVSLMYMITTMDDLFGDSLCILVTAHDDLEERLCCYAYEACIPYPDCPEPCEEVGARVVPSYQGDAATCCGGDPLEYEWLQDLIGDCTQRPCGAEVYCCELEDGTRVIRVAPDPAFPCADFPTELYGCDGTLIATSGGIAGGQLPPLVGCRKIYDCFEPDLNECCFDLLLTDTFTADPGLITAIQTTILNTGVTFSGQDRLGALLNGWTPTDLVPDRDILWNHSSGVTPNGVDQYLFSFCVEGTTSTDSVYVEVDFLNGRDSLICTDTVAVYCPYCLQIVNDSLTCVTDPLGNQTYLYEFSFVNSSAFDVNAVYISDEDTQALPDTVLNPGVHLLGSFVPPGATYTGTIPVEFDLGLDSACFDIVLRQIIGDSINISCCYATHCIELPPCDSLDQRQCPSRVVNDDIICLDVYEPVCGCDDVTYSNICYAERVGVITWTPGPCPNVNDPIDDVTLVGQPGDAGNQLNWTVNPPPADYAFFLVRKRDDTEGDYWTIADIPATDVLAYDFLHVNAAMGLTTYQILAVRSDGRVVASNTVELLRREMMGLRTTVYAYPSPAREELHVTVNRLGDATLELVSTDGQISQREHATFNGNPYTVDMSGLGNGVYIVRLRFDDGEIVQQRVVRVRE